MLSRSRLLAASLALGVLLTPRVAAACSWNYLHEFIPFPPCTTADQPTGGRMTQINLKIVGNLALLASKIREVAVEVNQWQRAATIGDQWEAKLRATYGTLTTSPLPSMVAAYNHTGMGSYLHLAGNGLDLSLQPRDLRASLDTLRDRLVETAGAQYKSVMATGRSELKQAEHTPFQLGAQLDRQIQTMTDWRKESRLVMDSVLAAGQRHAARYDTTTSVAGTSEAHLSLLGARMSLLRGTSLEVQARALEARMRALEATQSTDQDLAEIRVRTNPLLYRP